MERQSNQNGGEQMDEQRIQSEEISELVVALIAAQEDFQPALKSADNPFFHSKYAPLHVIKEASEPSLRKHGLVITQSVVGGTPVDITDIRKIGNQEQVVTATAWVITVITTLYHTSGQWIRSYLTIPVEKTDSQGVGSATSYGCRYGHQALIGLPIHDDDGQAASKQPAKPPVVQPQRRVISNLVGITAPTTPTTPQTAAPLPQPAQAHAPVAPVAAKPRPEAKPAQTDDNNMRVWSGIIQATSSKPTKKEGTTRYGIKIQVDGADAWANTISDEIGQAAIGFKEEKEPVTITFKSKEYAPGKFSIDIVEIHPTSEEPPIQEQAGEQEEVKDDLPF